MIDAMLRASAGHHGDRTAIVFGRESIGYRELVDRIAALRTGLAGLGVARGDCVLLVLPNSPAFVYTYFATAGLAATVVALDPGLTEAEFVRIRTECAPAVVVTDAAHAPLFAGPGAPRLVLTAGGDIPPGLPHTPFEELLAAEPSPAPETDGGPWVHTYSSGSTGEPRRVCRSQANQVAEAQHIVRSAGITPDDVVLSPVPLFHALGQFCCLIVAMAAGATLVLVDEDEDEDEGRAGGSIARLGALVRAHGVTVMPAVPYIFEALADLPPGDGSDFSSLRLCLSGSNFLTPAVRERFRQRHGVEIRGTYGSSEAGSVSWDCGPGPAVPGSVGRPLEGVRVRIVGEDGEQLPAGAEGEITVVSAAVALAWRDGGTTVEPAAGEPYFTGDLGRLDAAGNLYVTGRKRVLIDVGGHKVNPVEVEEVLESLPGVREAAVVALPSGGTDQLTAALVLAEGTDPAELAAACRTRLTGYKVPQRFVPVDALPRSPLGKLRRGRLIAELAALTPDAAVDERPDPWAEPDPVLREQALSERLAELVAEILGTAPGEVPWDVPLRGLGLDSLGALRLKMALAARLGRTLGLTELLGPCGVAGFARRLAAGSGSDAAFDTLSAGPQTGDFPLSHNQAAIWHADRLTPESVAYHLSFAARIVSKTDPEALRRAFQSLTDRNPVLRTTYGVRAGVPFQRVAAATEVDFAVVPLGEQEPAEALAAAAGEPFDLAARPPLRVRLFTAPDSAPVLLVTQHHIATDYWSLVTLLGELGSLYGAEAAGAEVYRPAPLWSYTDYTRWLATQVAGPAGRADIAYWRDLLGELPPVLELPTDRPRPPVRAQRGDTFFHTLGGHCADRVRDFAAERGTTVYTVLLTAFHLMLGTLTGERDTAVAAISTSRGRQEFHDVLGCFAQQLVSRVVVDEGEAFETVLERVRAGLLGAMEHQLTPFAAVVEELGVRRDPSRAPLVDFAFGQNKAHDQALSELSRRISGGAGAPLRVGALDLEPVRVPQRGTVFDFSGAVYESDEALTIAWEYSLDLFDETTVRRYADHFEALLTAVLSAPERPVGAELLLDATWRERLLAAAAGSPDHLPDLVELLDRQAEERPEAKAFGSLTHGELRQRAAAVDEALAAAGVGSGARVGLWLPTPEETAAAALGVWRRGGVVELRGDGASGAEGCAALVTSPERRAALSGAGVPVLTPGAEPGGPTAPAAPRRGPALLVREADRTRVIDHQALARCAAWPFLAGAPGEVRVLGPGDGETTLVWGLAAAAASGSAVPGTEVTADSDVLVLTAARLRGLLADPARVRGRVACLVVVGEPPSGAVVRRWREAAGEDARVVAVHGTGATGPAVAWGEAPRDLPERSPAPVDRVFPGVRRHVLDGAGALCPPGVIGEICVAEAGGTGQLLRTGEAGRYTVGGDIAVEVLGRTTDLVRVDGGRVLLGDVARALLTLPGVADAAVSQSADGSLTACVDVAGDQPPTGESLRAALRTLLPRPLVPAAVTVTAHRAEAAATADPGEPEPAEAPATSTAEQVLGAVWSEVLGRDEVSPEDNYFDLDGDSITALSIVALAAEQGVQVTVRQIFTTASLRDLAAVAVTETPVAPVAAAPAPRADRVVPLTPVQRWFFELDLADPDHWNQVLAFRVDPQVDGAVLREAIRTTAARHPAFRLRFTRGEDGWTQREDLDAEPVRIVTAEAPGASVPDRAAALAAEVQREIGLDGRTLLAAGLSAEPDGGTLLCLAAHHLVVDFVSWGVVLDDLNRALRAADGTPPAFAPATTDFPAWADALAQYATAAPGLAAARARWQRPATSQPSPRPGAERDAGTVTAALTAAETAALRAAAPEGARLHEVLLAAVCHALAAASPGAEVRVDVESHGRAQHLPGTDPSRSVGWFTCFLPVLYSAEADSRPREALKRVLDRLREDPDEGLSFGLLRYGADAADRAGTAGLPPAAAGYNHLGSASTLLTGAAKGAMLRPVPLPPGIERGAANARPYGLEISTLFDDGVLVLRIGHDGETGEAEARALADRILTAVRELLAPEPVRNPPLARVR